MPQSESERESRTMLSYLILAIPPSTDTESVEETGTTRLGDLITSICFKALNLAGIANVAITAAETSTKVMGTFRTRLYKDIA